MTRQCGTSRSSISSSSGSSSGSGSSFCCCTNENKTAKFEFIASDRYKTTEDEESIFLRSLFFRLPKCIASSEKEAT
jgi:hypothetical protein